MRIKVIISICLVIVLCAGCVPATINSGSTNNNIPTEDSQAEPEFTPEPEPTVEPPSLPEPELKANYTIGICSTRHGDACPKTEWNGSQGLGSLEGTQTLKGQTYRIIDIEDIIDELHPNDDIDSNYYLKENVLTAEAQIEQVELLVSRSLDLLVVDLFDPLAAKDISRIARDADIPCILFCRKAVDLNIGDYDNVCVIGFDRDQPVQYMIGAGLDLPQHGDKNGDGIVKYVKLTWNFDTYLNTVDTILKALDDAGVKTECVFSDDDLSEGTGNDQAYFVEDFIVEQGDVDLFIDFSGYLGLIFNQHPQSIVDCYSISVNSTDIEFLNNVPAGSCEIFYNMDGAIDALKYAVAQISGGNGNPGVMQVDYLKIYQNNIADYGYGGHQMVVF